MKEKYLEKSKSLWEQDAAFGESKVLHNKRVAQTVVIGAGMAGILTAYFLKKAGQCVIVVEARTIASGQTGRTTAKITSQHGLIYERMIREIGYEKAVQYASENQSAIDAYEEIIKAEGIECHFKRVPSYVYALRSGSANNFRKEADAARILGIDAKYVEGEDVTELPFFVKAAVKFENQAQFHPLKFLKKIAEGITIYEDTKVLKVKGHRVITNRGEIQAENIVFATHYPITNVPGFYFLRQHQERSYVLALRCEGERTEGGMYYGVEENALSLRRDGEVVLLGGGGHRTGKGCQCDRMEYLRKQAELYYPQAEEVAAWSAQDCMPHDGVPFIGRYSMLRPYWYVATGFGKWGMTTSMIAAKHISNAICGNCDTNSVFSPQRLYIRAGIKNLLTDVGESMAGLAKGIFAGKRKRCPHMGCKLQWNPVEESYECPCHGSRFDEKGSLLDNPAQIDLPSKV